MSWGRQKRPTEDVVHYYEDSAPGMWDLRIDHPDGSRTYQIRPCAHYPSGFTQTYPKEALDEAQARANGSWPSAQGVADELWSVAGGMVGFWWGLVAVLFVVFFIAEVFFGA